MAYIGDGGVVTTGAAIATTFKLDRVAAFVGTPGTGYTTVGSLAAPASWVGRKG